MTVIPPAVLTVSLTEYGVRRIVGIKHAHEYPAGPVPAAKAGVGCIVDLYGFQYSEAFVRTPLHPPGSTPISAAQAIADAAYAFLRQGVWGRA